GAALLLAVSQPQLEPRLTADVLQVAADALEVDRGAGDQEHPWGRLVHRAQDGIRRPGRRSRPAASALDAARRYSYCNAASTFRCAARRAGKIAASIPARIAAITNTT